MMIWLIALGLFLWLLLEEEYYLSIYHCTLWRDHPWVDWAGHPSMRGLCVPWKPSHGPQSWPWWRLLSVSVVLMRGRTLDPGKRKVGVRIWIYTRWFDQHLDLLARWPINQRDGTNCAGRH